jgi:hypothetical protein
MTRAAAADPLRPIPMLELSKGRPFGPPPAGAGFSPAAIERAWAEAQRDLGGLVPCEVRVVAADSSHYIQLERPDLVVGAVRRVVGGARAGSRCPAPPGGGAHGTDGGGGRLPGTA